MSFEKIKLNDKEKEKLDFAKYIGDQSNISEWKCGVVLFPLSGRTAMGVHHTRVENEVRYAIKPQTHLLFEAYTNNVDPVDSIVYSTHCLGPEGLQVLDFLGVARLVFMDENPEFKYEDLEKLLESVKLKVQQVEG